MTYKKLFEIASEQFLKGKITKKEFIEIINLVAKKIKLTKE